MREVEVLDAMLRAKATPQAALKKLQLGRCKDRTQGPSQSAVYAFWSGKSYARNKPARRGRKSKVPPGIARIANAERVKLLKNAKNTYRVTWEDVYKATKKSLTAKGCGKRSAICMFVAASTISIPPDRGGPRFPPSRLTMG